MRTSIPKHLLIIGLGYTGSAVARLAISNGMRVIATQRELRTEIDGVNVLQFDGVEPSAELLNALSVADAMLCTIAPDELGDPAARALQTHICNSANLKWIGYLSSTGVYGERNGGVVDESHEADGADSVALNRLKAEAQWRALATEKNNATFRLAGIYGPGRNAIRNLAQGTARNIDAPGILFNRIHVEDIAHAVMAAMQRQQPNALYLLADEEPAEQSKVIQYAAEISGLPLPDPMSLDDPRVSDGLRRFYQSSKRIDATNTWNALGIKPLNPSYRAGLDAIWLARKTL